MPRRSVRNVTNIRGTGAVDAGEVWRVFECARPGCDCLLKVSEDRLAERRAAGEPATVDCPRCGFSHDAALVERAARWKYCRVCEWLQPLDRFHRHRPTGRSFRSGHQLECKLCKNTRINAELNPRRTSDQHREAAQGRRLYSLLAGAGGKLDSRAVYERFGGRCFHCDRPLTHRARGGADYHLDHTLPAKYLWPATTATATLLCAGCNNAKHEKWPSEFYADDQLRRLAVLTGLPHELLAGPPRLNEAAVLRILAGVDDFLQKWIAYPDEVRRVRWLIHHHRGIDIFERARSVPEFLRELL